MNSLIDEGVRGQSLLGPKLNTLETYLARVQNVRGAAAELGVYKGGSARLIARWLPERLVYLFDTFKGMPFQGEGDHHPVGDFNQTSMNGVADVVEDCPNTLFRPGVFPASAAVLGHLRFCFVHIDGDQYQTTRDALEWFYPRMAPGGVMVFDDYEWPACPGVARALHEFLQGKPETLETPFQYQAVIVKKEVL